MHTFRHGKPSQYSAQLREKQKVKRYYGMRERPFRRLFHEAERLPGHTGEALVEMLERRLDNVVYLAGFAPSRSTARQMISHGLIIVNDHRVDVASFLVGQDDVIRPWKTEKTLKLVQDNLELTKGRQVPSWIQVAEAPPAIVVRTLPGRDEISVETREQMIVELLSK
jgi:small subunit ribosomal protein S4